MLMPAKDAQRTDARRTNVTRAPLVEAGRSVERDDDVVALRAGCLDQFGRPSDRKKSQRITIATRERALDDRLGPL